jgi:polyhydroxybutyrate depolymerase
MAARPSFRPLTLAGAIAVLLAVALVRLGGGSAPRAEVPAVDAARACATPAGTTVRVSISVSGQGERSALVHLPKARHGRMPLILALHGAYGTGAFMEGYSGLSRLADRQGFGVVYPDSVGPKWRITAAEGDTDVRFLEALIDRVLVGGCFDERRVSAVGVSNGGGMAARFACSGDDRLAGLVAVAGAYGPLPACRARRALSVLEIHGTADAVVPYHGTPHDPNSDVLGWVRGWVGRDACRPDPKATSDGTDVERFDWTRCRGGTEVSHLRLIGGAHAWPGADPPDPGRQLGVSAAEEAWRFLRGRRLAPERGERRGRRRSASIEPSRSPVRR